jgi:hypothetical protein
MVQSPLGSQDEERAMEAQNEGAGSLARVDGGELLAVPPPAPATPRAAAVATLVLALAAGVASSLVGEWQLDRYTPSEKAEQRFSFEAINRETARANSYNGALAFGVLGGLLGLAMGLAGGLARGSSSRAVVAGIVGLVLGIPAGVGPSLGLIYRQFMNRNDDPASTDLVGPMLTHAGIWVGLGLVAGLAYGLGRAGPKGTTVATMIGGAVGAVVGAVAYELIGAIGFPMARTTDPISAEATTRILAQVLVALAVGVGIVLATRPPRRRAGDVRVVATS